MGMTGKEKKKGVHEILVCVFTTTAIKNRGGEVVAHLERKRPMRRGRCKT